LGGILLIAMVLSLALWVLTSGPVWTLLAAWPAAAALVSGWLWSIHILVRAVSSQ
jgi:hypothetical protein